MSCDGSKPRGGNCDTRLDKILTNVNNLAKTIKFDIKKADNYFGSHNLSKKTGTIQSHKKPEGDFLCR